jgi:hypothetical protein
LQVNGYMNDSVSIRNEYDIAEKLSLPRQSPDHYL